MEKIEHFRGQYGFLSNFHRSPMTVRVSQRSSLLGCQIQVAMERGALGPLSVACDGNDFLVVVPTVEHGFQSDKTVNSANRLRVLQAPTPAEAKKCGRRTQLRNDWDEVKLDVMYGWLRRKFSIPEFKTLLLATGDAEIVEVNDWRDSYWGVYRGVGENHLGRLLMEIRSELFADAV